MKNHNEKGSLTIEAILSFTIFLFFFVTIISILNFCRAQATMSMMVNGISDELSQYSYMYHISGLQDVDQGISKNAEYSKEHLGDIMSSFDQITTEIGSLTESSSTLTDFKVENIGDAKGMVEEAIKVMNDTEASASSILEASENLENTIRQLAADPSTFMKSLVYVFGEKASNEAKSLLAKELSIALGRKYLGATTEDQENRLLSLGIVPKGSSYYDGLHFDYSQMFHSDAPEDILITVVYEVELIQLLDIDLKGTFVQSAYTRAWLGGDLGNVYLNDDGEKKEVQKVEVSSWDAPPVIRGKNIIQSELLKQNKNGVLDVSNSGIDGYDPLTGQLVKINSIDPYSPSYSNNDGTINKDKLQNQIERLVNKAIDNGNDLDTISVLKPDNNGSITSEAIHIDKSARSYKIIIVVPQETSSEIMKSIINDIESKNNHLVIESYAGYGNSPNNKGD